MKIELINKSQVSNIFMEYSVQIGYVRKPIGAMRKYFFIWRPPLKLIIWRPPLNLTGGRHLNYLAAAT